MLRFENISLKNVLTCSCLRSTSLNIATGNEMFLLAWVWRKLKSNMGLQNRYIQGAALSSAFWALVGSHCVLTAVRSYVKDTWGKKGWANGELLLATLASSWSILLVTYMLSLFLSPLLCSTLAPFISVTLVTGTGVIQPMLLSEENYFLIACMCSAVPVLP